jgi:hypothetical protein
MADFTISSDTLNNPVNWFTGSNNVPSYSYTEGTDVLMFGISPLLSTIGVGDNDLHATTGDVRSVYLAVAEALFLAYDAKDDASATTSNRLKMTRSQAVDSTNNIRYTTYTIHVQEDGTGTAESFSSSGVRAE